MHQGANEQQNIRVPSPGYIVLQRAHNAGPQSVINPATPQAAHPRRGSCCVRSLHRHVEACQTTCRAQRGRERRQSCRLQTLGGRCCMAGRAGQSSAASAAQGSWLAAFWIARSLRTSCRARVFGASTSSVLHRRAYLRRAAPISQASKLLHCCRHLQYVFCCSRLHKCG